MRRNFPQMATDNIHEMKIAPNHPADILDQITPVQRFDSKRADEICRKLEHIIAACDLKAGDCLGTKEDLRRRFQVSPATMNEAVRILESRGVIETRRGLRGGVFVSRIPVQVALRHIARALDANTALKEYCWAVSMQLEPLVVAEATKSAGVDSIAELNSLVSRMAVAVDNPIELLRRYSFLYRRIAAMGSNPLLTGIYTALIDLLEQRNESLYYSIPRQLLAKCHRVVEAIASGDTQRAATATAQDPSRYPRSLPAVEPLQTLNQAL
jgi:DNA-binding FadR family transcriptional regulator